MHKYLKFFVVGILVINAAACSLYKKNAEQKNVYAENHHLIIPNNLSGFKTENYYPIPNLPKAASKMHSKNSSELVYPPGSK